MKKVELISYLTQKFEESNNISFAYLSGDIINDEYLDNTIIDYHIGISNNIDEELISILDGFDQILHLKKSKKIFTVIYDNGVMINVHKEVVSEVITPKKYAKLFDKTNTLENAPCKLGKLTDFQVSELVNDFSIDLYKFVLNYKYKDVIYLQEILNKLQKSLVLFLVYLSNNQVSNYDIKDKFDLIENKYKIELAKIIKECKYNTLLQTAQLYTLLMIDITKTLRFEIGQNVNYDLLNFSKKGLFSL